jgi:hypothetical protein
VLCRLYPLDKHKNAEGLRRPKEPLIEQAAPVAAEADGRMAPLLRKLIAEYAATGLPPAYLPKNEQPTERTATDE